MEFSHNERSPKVCLPSEDDDVKYVSGLSTVLVTTIQEAKDRISEIEYIFSNKLYPNVQKSSKCLQKYCEARKAAEDEYKERVNDLELRVEQLRVEKDQACEYSNAEKSKLLGKIADLEEKLLHKAKEVDDGKVSHGKLLDLIESKTSIITNKENQMKEHEERTNVLMSKLKELEGSIVTLNKEIREKNEEVSKGKELREELTWQIESQAIKITSSEFMLASLREDNKELAVECVNAEVGFLRLKNKLKRKNVELEEGFELQEQFIQQINLNGVRLTKKNQQLSVCEGEKNRLLSRINDLEKEVEVLQEEVREIKAEGESDPSSQNSRSLIPPQTERRRGEEAEQKAKLDEIAEKLKQRENWRYLDGDVDGWGLPDGDGDGWVDWDDWAKRSDDCDRLPDVDGDDWVDWDDWAKRSDDCDRLPDEDGDDWVDWDDWAKRSDDCDRLPYEDGDDWVDWDDWAKRSDDCDRLPDGDGDDGVDWEYWCKRLDEIGERLPQIENWRYLDGDVDGWGLADGDGDDWAKRSDDCDRPTAND